MVEPEIMQILADVVEQKASDLHITVALPPMVRVNQILRPYSDQPLTPADTERIVKSILTPEQMLLLDERGELDFSYIIPQLSRFRVNAYKQRSSYGIAMRVINIAVPTIDELGFPSVLKDLALKTRGLILLTGPTGSGKSTTLAAMINHINRNRNCHILTLEEPIEYLHAHGTSMVNQREIGSDTKNFANGLRAALREDPDVIMVGEMRDLETISTAITAAETGHLVLSTLHTTGSEQTIDRIIDVFPPHQQQQVRVQLAVVLQAIISQLLLPTVEGDAMIAAQEILVANNAVRSLIRDNKTNQLETVIQTGSKEGMVPLDLSLSNLVKASKISKETAYTFALDREMLQRYLNT